MECAARAALVGLALAAGLACRERGSVPPGELFLSSCATCHVPPDPAFAVERAWLAQLADTA